jgi:hypothetical protein
MKKMTRRGFWCGFSRLGHHFSRQAGPRGGRIRIQARRQHAGYPILTASLTEAARAIGEQSAGRLSVTGFPNTSSAAIPRCCRSFVPAASSYWRRPRCRYRRWYHRRAFPVSASPSSPYDRVWAAMDGWVGDIVRDGHRKGRHRADAEEAGQRLPPDHLIVQPAIEWRRGSQGFKIRVSVTALLTSLFSDPGALPSSISYSELYSALQTHYRGGPGESDGAGVDRQAVGGAEIQRAVEPLLERLLGRRQPPGAGESAGRPARNRQRQF